MNILSFLITWAGFTLVYLSLSENWSLSNILLGGFLSLCIFPLWRMQGGKLESRFLWGQTIALIKHIFYLFIDVFLCGISTAKIVLSRHLPIRPGIIAIKDDLVSDSAKIVSAHSLTLTPGDIVLETDSHGTFYIHTLDINFSEKEGADAHQKRVNIIKNIFVEEKKS